jgi:hypothetical protein
MPALGVTVQEETVRAAFESMSRSEFKRAYCNQWVSSLGDGVIDLDEWGALAEPDAPRPERLVLSCDVAPRSKSATITAAGERDGILYVSVLEHGEGTDWLLPTLQALCAELNPAELIADAKSAAPLLTTFFDTRVVETSAQDMATGCSFLLNLIRNKRIRHRGERELAIAIDGAATRPLGDAFGWSRKSSGVDISPIVSVTLGVWAHHTMEALQ